MPLQFSLALYHSKWKVLGFSRDVSLDLAWIFVIQFTTKVARPRIDRVMINTDVSYVEKSANIETS